MKSFSSPNPCQYWYLEKVPGWIFSWFWTPSESSDPSKPLILVSKSMVFRFWACRLAIEPLSSKSNENEFSIFIKKNACVRQKSYFFAKKFLKIEQKKLVKILINKNIKFICLAGFMKILSPYFLNFFKNKNFIHYFLNKVLIF